MRSTPVLLLGLLLTPALRADHVQLGLRLPDGFTVREFAGPDLVNDAYTLAVDPKGHIVVSGRGYVRILADDDGDGRADRAIQFADGPSDGAMGLLWEKDTLYFTGDGGLRAYRDADGDDRVDGPSTLIRAMKTGGEHDAHAIRRGPDGWLYVLCGNNTGIDQSFAQLSTSPVKDPVAGCVLRFTPDLRQSEIFAHGFRNAYDMDFNAAGDLFSYDSDNERCVGLPWYEGTRFYHVPPGGHHGWLSPQRGQFWRMPPYFPDVVPPLLDLGRGSPTGVACYRHTSFPERYRDGFFLQDWTFGRIYHVRVSPKGAGYHAASETFIEAVGDNGFAPTGIAVHPRTGDLYVSVGGRGTRGAVYRISGDGSRKSELLTMTPRPLAIAPGGEHLVLQDAQGDDLHARRRALALLVRQPRCVPPETIGAVLAANASTDDRLLRQQCAQLVQSMSNPGADELRWFARSPQGLATWLCAGLPLHQDAEKKQLAQHVRELPTDQAGFLDLVRAVQVLTGDVGNKSRMGTVWEGYSRRHAGNAESYHRELLAAHAERYPAKRVDVNREILRVLAINEAADLLGEQRVLAEITPASDPVEDEHRLIFLARVPRGSLDDALGSLADAWLHLDRKFTTRKQTRDRNWPLRMAETYSAMAKNVPALNDVLVAHVQFGRPDHVLFTQAADFPRARAAEIFLARGARQEDFDWSPAHVELLGALPMERTIAEARALWPHQGVRDAIVTILAKKPTPEDRARFLDGLASPQLATIRHSLAALERLPVSAEANHVFPLVRLLRSLATGKDEVALKEQAGRLLQQTTGLDLPRGDANAWTDWFTRAHPALANKLTNADGVDRAAWDRRLATIDWTSGDGARGQAVFRKAGCASCHSSTQALGPDLAGVTSRFGFTDLVTTIIQPSKDVSPRYQTTLLATADGKTHQGTIIYEATDGVLLQTGPTTMVRIAGDQIVSRRPAPLSLMPAGLLDSLTNAEIGDLFAYLKTLKK